ncbi:hypothetical protein BX600DRAFT_25419 [Xylariales sp. PMI_506]|nr:hypothetical protein BX600DRAFT_25419 [Xylariales sp. PMI_506]
MFIRPAARRSLSSHRIALARRPQLLPRCSSCQALPSSSRLLVTRPDSLLRRTRRNSFGRTSQERSLATAIDDARITEDVTFGVSSIYPQASPTPKIYELRSFDPATSLRLKHDHTPPPRLRTNTSGIPGDIQSMMSVFDACLKVDHLERASLVLQRLQERDYLPGSELIEHHNRYLRANIDRFYTQPDIKWAESMQAWYETRIRAAGLPQTPETIACMLKVSLLSTQDNDKLQRRVDRYMGMMPGDAGLEVFSMADILSDQDLAKITSLCTTHTYSADDWILESEDLVQTELDSASQLSPEEVDALADVDGSEVRAVPQKGLGLKTLRGVLSFFEDIKGRNISQLPIAEQREIQSRLERDCVDAAIHRWREEHQALLKMGRNTSLSTPALNSQLYDWHCNLEKRIKQEFTAFDQAEKREVRSGDDLDRLLIAPFMRQSTPSRLAALSILTMLNSLAQAGADSGPPLSNTVQNIGKAVEDDIRAQQRIAASAQKAKLAKLAKKRVLRSQMEGETQAASTEEPATPADSNIIEVPAFDVKNWPPLTKTKIGACLLLSLLESTKIKVVREHPETKALVSQLQPAFAKTTIFKKGKKVGLVMPNKQLVTLLQKEPRGEFLARHLPMLVQPEPWTRFDKGGLLEYPSSLIRVKNGDRDQVVYAEAAINRGDLDQVCKGLDVLGRTAWRINRNVFDVMLEAWNSGDAIANLPPLNPDIPLPPEPESTDDPMQRRIWLQAVKAIENEKSGLHSERCFMNFQMEIANAFKDQTFYFPHNVDFRGRAYPMPIYLNHMGADNVRGLLQFDRGKELGEGGLRWLKVHLANVFGYDKASLAEREQFAVKNMDSVLDSAKNPLGGRRWWLKAEDQWQCLAACFELAAAMQSPEPAKYVSHLPVHQDGTCNGLQHYAALGGDLWGAQQVNLEPGDRPADVYSAVADLVKQSIAEDVKEGHTLAKAMDGKITRKVVKQTVMTNVYGVTFIGARAQVQKQIEAAYPNIQAETGWSPTLLATYVATKVFKALSTMFRGAHDIQYWLGECAGRVCKALTPEQLDRMAIDAEIIPDADSKAGSRKKGKKSALASTDVLTQFRSTIVWTTPLRLPVVQPYRKSATRTISTVLQDLNLQIPERSDPVNRRKQLQAFPPNFIHSLDASHMLLSALECDSLDLDFAAVHDSFWTHAADVDVMNRVLRDAFIRIHSDNVIERLDSEFKERYKGSLYLANIEPNSQVGRAIQIHRFKERLNLAEEALVERKRLALLNSSDPAEVEQGRRMKTPASIVEEFSAAQASAADGEMDEVGLGHVPASASPPIQTLSKKAMEKEASRASIMEDPEAIEEHLSMKGFEAKLKGSKATLTKSMQRPQNVWLPLTFPKIPEKGDFDVTRLKSSQYFFS